MTARVVFLDTETTGLDADAHEIWEVGLIDGDDEWTWQLPVDEGRADTMGLKIGGYYERRAKYGTADYVPGSGGPNGAVFVVHPERLGDWCRHFARLTAGVHLCGAVVNFDEERLRRLLRRNGACPGWHYHLIDVEALAVGYLAGRWAQARDDGQAADLGPFDPALPWDSDRLSRAVGVDPDKIERHTALGDARWAKAIYDAVMAGVVA